MYAFLGLILLRWQERLVPSNAKVILICAILIRLARGGGKAERLEE
jgi:hypothetical protein